MNIIKLEISLLDLQNYDTSDISEVLDTFDSLSTKTYIVSFGEELNRAILSIVLKNEQFPEVKQSEIIPTYYIEECNKCLDLYCSYIKHECVAVDIETSGSLNKFNGPGPVTYKIYYSDDSKSKELPLRFQCNNIYTSYNAKNPGTYWFLENEVKFYPMEESKGKWFCDDWEKYHEDDKNRGNKWTNNYVTISEPGTIYLIDGIISSVYSGNKVYEPGELLLNGNRYNQLNTSSNLTTDLINDSKKLLDKYEDNHQLHLEILSKQIIKNTDPTLLMGYEEEQDSFEDWSVYGFPTPKTFPKECEHEWKEIELFTSKVIECTKCNKVKGSISDPIE